MLMRADQTNGGNAVRLTLARGDIEITIAPENPDTVTGALTQLRSLADALTIAWPAVLSAVEFIARTPGATYAELPDGGVVTLTI
jgi:hypothetical protein